MRGAGGGRIVGGRSAFGCRVGGFLFFLDGSTWTNSLTFSRSASESQ